MKLHKLFCIVFLCALFMGCVRLQESAKVIWGSSTRALEEARYDAASATYRIDVYNCFNEVLDVARNEGLDIFIEDRNKDLIVVMGVPESINTTEVGIFFTDTGLEETEVEIVSLSPQAQATAAGIIFPSLEKTFSKVE